MTGYHWEAKSGKVSWLRLNVIRDEVIINEQHSRSHWRDEFSSTNSNSYNSRISKFLNRFEHHWRGEHYHQRTTLEKPLTWRKVIINEQQLIQPKNVKILRLFWASLTWWLIILAWTTHQRTTLREAIGLVWWLSHHQQQLARIQSQWIQSHWDATRLFEAQSNQTTYRGERWES